MKILILLAGGTHRIMSTNDLLCISQLPIAEQTQHTMYKGIQIT